MLFRSEEAEDNSMPNKEKKQIDYSLILDSRRTELCHTSVSFFSSFSNANNNSNHNSSGVSGQQQDYTETFKFAILKQNGKGGRKYAALYCYPDRRGTSGIENIDRKRREGLPNQARADIAETGSEARK